uniref:RING-type domain-containing protein n=1 Tax=Cyanistes caeruleus TaxID=156563 RepID=A0A8C0U738_CYACU
CPGRGHACLSPPAAPEQHPAASSPELITASAPETAEMKGKDERLSNSVLPCQHTFCKPCLQRILKSQKELRCPECRTLVLGSIEQLPSNLLLIRLLDGVRCGQNVTRFGSIQRSGVLSSPASIRRVPRGLQLHQHRLATNPRLHMEGVRRKAALCSL